MNFFSFDKLKTNKQLVAAAAGVSVAALAGFALWKYTQTIPESSTEDSGDQPKSHTIVSSLDFELFDCAVKFVSSPPAGHEFQMSTTQCTTGPCSAPEPGMLELDFSKHMKWKAWKALGDMPKADAAIEYTRRVERQAPGWRAAAHLRPELQEHVAGAAPDQPQPGQGGGEEEEEEQNFEMGPSVSRLDVDALSKEEEQLRESRTSAVVLSVEAGDLDAVVSALQATPADANAKNEFGEPVLHIAVNNGKAEVVQRLLEAGAHPDATDDEAGMTALMYCTFLSDSAQSAEIARLLLDAGADKAATSDEGTAYDMAQDAEMGDELLTLLKV